SPAPAPMMTVSIFWKSSWKRFMLSDEFPVDVIILLFENIKYHLLYACVCVQIILNCLYRNFRCLFLWKMNFSGGNTAERNTFQTAVCRKLQAGLIAVCKLSAMLICQVS